MAKSSFEVNGNGSPNDRHPLMRTSYDAILLGIATVVSLGGLLGFLGLAGSLGRE